MIKACIVAFSALVLPTAATASEVYSACYYQDRNTGISPITQLFTLEGDALKDSYGAWSYERAKASDLAAKQPYEVLEINGYMDHSVVGQFMKFARDDKGERANCWMTTDRNRAFSWYRQYKATNRLNNTEIFQWRPKAASFVKAEDWPAN